MTTKKKTAKTKKKVSKKASKKNPLYVVTKKGKVVEEATNILDAIAKKLGMAPAMKMLGSLLNTLLAQMNSYAMVQSFLDIVNQFIEKLTSVFVSKEGEAQGV